LLGTGGDGVGADSFGRRVHVLALAAAEGDRWYAGRLTNPPDQSA
jgi:hypothetical protein